LSELEEARLIARIKRGDRPAFGILVKAHRERAFGAALAIVRNHEEARDLSQEAFIKAWKAIDRFDGTRPFYPWFYRILRNLCLTYIERHGPARKVSLDEMLEANPSAAPTVNSSVQDRIHSEQMSRHLVAAMEKLKPAFREIILMYHYEDMDYKAIAAALQIPIGTVMSRLSNARKALGELMKEHRP
jgi:RNA polymerase sigma-70 factor (ECF subfamily)